MSTCVVVVEDEPSILEMLRDVLEDHGASVVSFAYPEMACALDTDLHPNLFLLDMMLPGMSGVELAAQLRASGYELTPMIAMSASPLMLDIAEASALFQAIVPKPFDLSLLLDSVDRYASSERLTSDSPHQAVPG